MATRGNRSGSLQDGAIVPSDLLTSQKGTPLLVHPMLHPNIGLPRDAATLGVIGSAFPATHVSPLKSVFLGSYALHTEPKSEAILCVSVSLSMFEDEKTRDRSTRFFYNLAGRLGSSHSTLFHRPLLLPACCCHCVLNCSRFLCVGKFWRAFHRKLAVFVQGKLFSISKLLCRVVYDLSFMSKINCTALPCLFFVISFRC